MGSRTKQKWRGLVPKEFLKYLEVRLEGLSMSWFFGWAENEKREGEWKKEDDLSFSGNYWIQGGIIDEETQLE